MSMNTNQLEVVDVFDSDLYLYFYEDSITPSITELQCNAIINELNLKSPASMLDIACGHGRHASYLSAKGFKITGVDNNHNFINLAQKQSLQNNYGIQYFCEDMRLFRKPDEYDVAIMLFSSFGYFSDKDNIKIIENISASLKKNGKLCLDLMNRERLSRLAPFNSICEKENNLMIDSVTFDSNKSQLQATRYYCKDGEIKKSSYSVRLYSLPEIKMILELANLRIDKVYGDWNNELYTAESKRLLLYISKK